VKKKVQRRIADTSPTKEVVVDSLTRDATTEACVFDLVDNAIDSARELLHGKAPEPLGLPQSYVGFAIDLVVGSAGVEIEDNAGGMSAEDIAKRVLRFGRRAGRSHGIGFYGVGLNRAIFKLGRLVELDADDGQNRSLLKIDVADYLKKRSWRRPFEVMTSSGKTGSRIVLTDPAPEIARDLSDPNWQGKVRENLGRRYHLFLEKGLTIKFQGQPVEPIYVRLRQDSPFPKLQKSYKAGEHIWIHIEAGEHQNHRFPSELTKGESNPADLTREYGWSIICNDRQILEADRTEKTGWEPTWHNEYNGFVGTVHFISPSPDLLPWNTSKTDVDRNNAVYRQALGDMQSFTQRWRQYTRAAKKIKRSGGQLPIPAARKPAVKKPSSLAGKSGQAATHERSVLPYDVDEARCSGKLLQIVRECKQIDFFENPYAGLAMLRVLFEIASIHFLKRHQALDDCRTWCIAREEAERGKPYSKAHRMKYLPGVAGLLLFFTERWDSLLDGAHAAYLSPNFDKFKHYKSEMDNAVHHPFHETAFLRSIEMRDSVIPFLRHLIEA
jgi:hypothetical protein